MWDPEKLIRLTTDASKEGLGMVLEQMESEEWVPLEYYSRTWRPNERNWLVHHWEMCAFVEGLQKWVRDRRAGYEQSLSVLRHAKKSNPRLVTKSSIMLVSFFLFHIFHKKKLNNIRVVFLQFS